MVVPLIAGSRVLRGGPVGAEDRTTEVAFEATVFEPALFVAVTRTRIRRPTSELASL